MRTLWFIAQILVVVTGALLAGGARALNDTDQFNFMNAGIGALVGSFYLPLWVYFGLFMMRISSSMRGEWWSEELSEFLEEGLSVDNDTNSGISYICHLSHGALSDSVST